MKSQFEEEVSNVRVLPIAFNFTHTRTEVSNSNALENSLLETEELEDLHTLINNDEQIIYREFDYKKTIKEKYSELEKFGGLELQHEINQMNYLEERIKLMNDMTNRLKYYLDDINMLIKSKKA